MVISGTHALDMCMWYLEKKTPVECYARSIDKVLGPLYQGIDATAGMIMMSDNSVYHLNISWALPVTWPGAVYSLEVGIVGTDGVLTIDDTHRDMVLAVSKPQGEGYAPDQTRLVDFLGSYPPGDMALGELRGPMADETVSWLNRVALGLPTPAATVEEAHNNLMLTKALDLSAKRKQPVKLPLDPDEEKRARRQPASCPRKRASSTRNSLRMTILDHRFAGMTVEGTAMKRFCCACTLLLAPCPLGAGRRRRLLQGQDGAPHRRHRRRLRLRHQRARCWRATCRSTSPAIRPSSCRTSRAPAR